MGDHVDRLGSCKPLNGGAIGGRQGKQIHIKSINSHKDKLMAP